MCEESHSGVTRRWKYREANWACTVCGTNFTRKNNAERHVSNVHSGEGGVQALGNRPASDSLFLTQSPPAPSSLFLQGRKARQLLDEQSETVQGRVLNLVKHHSGYPFFDLAGRVCKDCLKIVLEGVIRNRICTTIIPRHVCKPEWLFDHPFLLNYINLIEKYLENKIGGIILNILCRNNEKFVSVYANEESRLANNKQEQVIADLCKIFSTSRELKETTEQIKVVLAREEKRIEADIDNNYAVINKSDFPWYALFDKTLAVRIRKEDVLMFLSVTKRSTAKCKIIHEGGERYFSIRVY
ncbi:MAG: hypothetical protein ACREAY_05270 [Nitrososphaera sp.]|uniref:hypothetical protein n=1 Tax=Nitrososphaera sp. TaxID=1971748 RepID=UPI003D6F124A